MKHPVYLCLSAYILICSIIRNESYCPQPDVPTNGTYYPKQKAFEAGDFIIYSCDKGFLLSGEEKRTCTVNEVWSHHSPFCDNAAKFEGLSVDSEDINSEEVKSSLDGNNKTCFEWPKTKGKYLNVRLAKKINITTVKIYTQKGHRAFREPTGKNDDTLSCSDVLHTDKQTVFKCRSKVLSNRIKIEVIENKTELLKICEVEVYGIPEGGCEQSPKRIVHGGHFKVSRYRADLICNDGFRSQENTRLLCERDAWVGGKFRCEEVLCYPIDQKGQHDSHGQFTYASTKLSVGTKSVLKCNAGYTTKGDPDTVFCQKDGVWTKTNATCVMKTDPKEKIKEKIKRIALGVFGVVVVIIIIGLLAAVIHFTKKQKNKEVVVVFQPQADDSGVSLFETVNEVPYYERLSGRVDAPQLPSTPRPMAKLSTMSKGGDIQRTAWKGTFAKNSNYSQDQ